ncbi:hypothetical protein WJX84_007065 [Apatococcus fuscideae]|uniref:Uncharacterized protein n=1 Tax=Apatococcus fuscideae TaxID=2026836 RepID=A0AAW1T1B2_9CHLO
MGRPGECNYSLLTDYEHNVNGQFVQRGQRLSDDGETWTDLPTLEDKATWLGSSSVIYKGDTVDVQRAEDHSVTVRVNGQAVDMELEANLPSGMNITYSNTTVPDGTLWFKPGEWTLPQVNIKTPWYEFEVSCPPNHSRRLDLTFRVVVQRDGTINPAEGVLGRTIQAMIDDVGFLDINHTDIVEVWDSEEMDHIRHSPSLEAKLMGDYTVSNLWASDAKKSNFGIFQTPKGIIAHITGVDGERLDGTHLLPESGAADIEVSRRRALYEMEMPVGYVGAGRVYQAGMIKK